MKARVVTRASDALIRRESNLKERFLRPIWTITSWDSASVDMAGAYVGLMHSEAEASLENISKLLLQHSRSKSEKYQPDDVLLNWCTYYRDELHTKFSQLDLSPTRKELAKDRPRLLQTWDSLGGQAYFQNRVAKSHGAGVRYIENLYHPLGLVISEKTFTKGYESKGIKRLTALGSGETTLLTEFVVLRGSAVHSGSKEFAQSIRLDTPETIAKRGQAVAQFVHDLGLLVARDLW